MMLRFKKSWPFIILAILSFTLHFAFLSHPPQVVFDEVHFGKFVSAYFTREYYFDIHPPLGKLMIAGWAKLNSFNPGNFDFDHIGEQASPQFFFTLRFLPAFFGALFILLFSWLAYLISRSRQIALIAGFLILFDNALLTQSKFILVDVFLIFFEVLTFCFFFLYQRQKSFSLKWIIFLILTAVSFGLAISIKWTGSATFGIIAIILLVKIFSKKLADYLSPAAYAPPERPVNIAKEEFLKSHRGTTLHTKIKEALIGLAAFIVIGFTVYAIPFAIHFSLLPKSGPGDAFMSQPFRLELKYGREITEQPLGFWQKFIELNKTMYTANAGITSEHPFGSRWFGWPLDHKPIYYWNQNSAEINGQAANIYYTGNPLIYWLTAIAILFTLIGLLVKKTRKKTLPIIFVLLLAYFANLLPFILIRRVSFLYHYLPAAAFGILILSFYLSRLWPREKTIFTIIFILIAIFFLFLAPLTYGINIPQNFYQYELRLINMVG